MYVLFVCLFVFSGQPDPPRNLESQEVTTDTVRLSWQPPAYDGGSNITTYVIEKKSVKSQYWGRCISTRNCFHTVTGLEPGTEYQFRVSALNLYGASEPCTASKAIATKRKFFCQFSFCINLICVYLLKKKKDFSV